jgi:hypothetical protein
MWSAELGTGQLLFWMLWFFLWIVWIYLLFYVFIDIFRSPDISGWGKALWCIFVILLPYLGVFVYLIARGGTMHARVGGARPLDAAMQQSVQSFMAGSSAAGEIARLADLRDQGVIDDAEFQRAKAKVTS